MKPLKKYIFNPSYPIAPGQTIKDTMQSLGMTQKELAIRLGTTPQSLVRIFNGEQPISYSTADRLELVTGVDASFWNNLEMQYRQLLAKQERAKTLETNLQWLKSIPTKELINRGLIKDSNSKTELVDQVFKFYGVASVESWHNIWQTPMVAARRTEKFESNLGHVSAWLRIGQLQAMNIDCNPFDKKKFESALQKTRKMTVLPISESIPKIRNLFAEAGVALSLAKEIKKVPWNGATQWLTPTKPMLLLCLRGKSEDIFWFSMFHEACHILNDSHKTIYINEGSSEDAREKAADDFAAESLIPQSFNKQILSAKSKSQIEQIANQLNISPGIVVGRYHYLTKKWHNFNELIRKIDWV